jgi:hypothetical protein
MSLSRALPFSICATVANWASITIGVFLTTALQMGVTPRLFQQLLQIVGNMLSPGWLAVTVFAAAFSFAGWLVVQRANSASGSGRALLLGAATCLIALLPAGLALIVFNPAFVGLAIVLAVSGGAVLFASTSDEPSPKPVLVQAVATSPLTKRAVFGRRDL